MKNLIYKGQSRSILKIIGNGKVPHYELVTNELKKVELESFELETIWEVYTKNLVRDAGILHTEGNEKYKEAILEYMQVEKAKNKWRETMKRNYPWYKYKGQDVVLIDASENPKAKELGVENGGDIYAVLLEVARENFELNVENCKTTYILDYLGDSDRDIDNGKEIIVSQMKNPENEERIIECWGTLDDFSEE